MNKLEKKVFNYLDRYLEMASPNDAKHIVKIVLNNREPEIDDRQYDSIVSDLSQDWSIKEGIKDERRAMKWIAGKIKEKFKMIQRK